MLPRALEWALAICSALSLVIVLQKGALPISDMMAALMERFDTLTRPLLRSLAILLERFDAPPIRNVDGMRLALFATPFFVRLFWRLAHETGAPQNTFYYLLSIVVLGLPAFYLDIPATLYFEPLVAPVILFYIAALFLLALLARVWGGLYGLTGEIAAIVYPVAMAALVFCAIAFLPPLLQAL